MPLVSKPAACASLAERLARTGAGPDREMVGDAGHAERKGPYPDASEEMALGEAVEVGGADVPDVRLDDGAGGNSSICDEPAKPLRRNGIVLIVEGRAGHGTSSARISAGQFLRSWRRPGFA